MLKEQTWRALLSSWEKTVKYETSFILCFKTGKTHANRLSCLIVCTFIWLLNPTNCFPPLFVCSATPKFISVFLSCLSQAQQKWPRALCVCDPATVCCQETPVCYVALQPNALHCQLVLVLWNTEGEQCTLCHCPVAYKCLAYKKALHCLCRAWSLRSMLEWGDTAGALCWGVLFCFVLVQHLKWVRESPEGCWRERMGHQRSDGFRLLWSWDLPSQTTLVQWVTAAQSVKCPFSQPCSQ